MERETYNLCAIAGASIGAAKAFITAKTPVAAVREQLAARAATAADRTAVDGTARPAGDAEAAVAASWDEAVSKINATLPKPKG
jgi:hypothetical protein